MENHKAIKFLSASTRTQASLVLNRIASAIQFLLAIEPQSEKQLSPVRSAYTDDCLTSGQRALMNMINHGKQLDHADLILNESEDWERDYDSLNPSRLIKNNPHFIK